jgi:hypothetical protein
LNAYLLSHCDDLKWVRNTLGADVKVIAHEDYISLLVDEQIPCFFGDNKNTHVIDNAIHFLSFNWHRDENFKDLSIRDGISIAEAFSVGVWLNIAGICREYFAFKYWFDYFDCIYVSCNESPQFIEVAKKFGNRVQFYDPLHRHISSLNSITNRDLKIEPIKWSANILRKLQAPFLKFLRNKTLSLSDWSSINYGYSKGWIIENSHRPWRGAYCRKLPREYFLEVEKLVPINFNDMFAPDHLAKVLQRININWDKNLLVLLSECMTNRYRQYRYYFVSTVAKYKDLIDSYRPSEFVISSEIYEPYIIAAQIAKLKGSKISWLVDGYPIVAVPYLIRKASSGATIFDRIYAMGCQHLKRLLKSNTEAQEIVTIHPPILKNHRKRGYGEKFFDVIIMTWITNDHFINGRNGSRANFIIDALNVAVEAGLEKLAIKIKHHSEKEWLLPVLEKAGYYGKVTILEGRFSDYLIKARIIIGGISSGLAEAAYHNIPYYIYEPIANGYGSELISSIEIINEQGVARTPEELYVLLKNPEGSVTSNRELLFGNKCQHISWTWEKTRELYVNWVASWADRSGIKNVLQWRGLPLWWASNLVAKDTIVDNVWYIELHNRLRGSTYQRFKPFADILIYLGILKSLVKDISKWFFLRFLFYKKNSNAKSSIWFHSLEYNLINSIEGFCDRMYEHAPLDDVKHGFCSAYIIRLNFKKQDFMRPWMWRKKINEYGNRLHREVEILDRYLFLYDIFEIHFSLIKNYFKFKKFFKYIQRQGIYIGHVEFTDILLLEMQKSFLFGIPWSLNHAAMFERWLDKSNDKRTLITYGDTLAPMRPTYFFSHKQSSQHRWISIQHATMYKNKVALYHRFSEFNLTGPNDERLISPMPDYYFSHGSQWSNILSEFYPAERIRIIGCLKYDSLYRLHVQNQIRHQKCRRGPKRIMLLAPSLGDEEVILKMFSGLDALPGWQVLLSKHPAANKNRIDGLIRKNKISIPIEFNLSKPTIELMKNANLVVCSYSGVALEALFFGLPSVRVVSLEHPPVPEGESGVKYVTTQQEFLKLVNTQDLPRTSEINRTLNKFFYQFDGLVSSRFWVELAKLPDLH